MNPLYDTKEKRTIIRLFLWFVLISGNAHFYYTQYVAWALETASRGETAAFVAFLDISLFLFLLVWQGWDGFDSDISIRYFFSFGLAVLSYVVFYPAFYNSFHAITKMKEIYTLSGHPVVLTGYAILASIAAFWTFTGMFPTEAWDTFRGDGKKNRFVNGIHTISNNLKNWAESKTNRRLMPVPDRDKVVDIKQDSDRAV